jgi:flagellar biosynthesis/type III secretory pathway protein FliH
MILTCENCGEDLKFKELDLSKEELIVVPCENCIDKAENAGYDTGVDAGSEEDYQEGYDEGYKEGYKEALEDKP